MKPRRVGKGPKLPARWAAEIRGAALALEKEVSGCLASGLAERHVRRAREIIRGLGRAGERGPIVEAEVLVREATHEVLDLVAKKERLEKALVYLVGSTGRTKRQMDLVKVAEEVLVAEELMDSKKALAKRIGLSEEMVREFRRVATLSEPVKRIARAGELRSVDTAYRLSMLPKREQLPVARAYARGDLTGRDVRDVVSLRKREESRSIDEIVDQVRASRDIIQYVLRFRLPHVLDAETVRRRFARAVGTAEIHDVTVEGQVATVIVTGQGRTKLLDTARSLGLTKRQVALRVLSEKM